MIASVVTSRERLLREKLSLGRMASLLRNNPGDRFVAPQVHARAITAGLLLLHGYTRSFSSWMHFFSHLLRSYSLGGFPREAMLFYVYHRRSIDFGRNSSSPASFDSFTYTFLLNACVGIGCRVPGVQIHGTTLKTGFSSHVFVQTALVSMYLSCKCPSDALRVFEEMPERNPVSWNVLISGLINLDEFKSAERIFFDMPERTIVSWTSMIDGYTRANMPREAVNLFRRMGSDDGIMPSEITLLAIFPTISNLGDVRMCRSLHCYGEKMAFYDCDIRVVNCLIDSYSKCSSISCASRFFEEIPTQRKNLVSWSSVISAYAMHGMGQEAIESFNRMETSGWKPNGVVFLSLLNACSHGGFMEEGLKFFKRMVNEFRIEPGIKHYGSLIDLLGRAGRLEEAEKTAANVVPQNITNNVIWRTLLGACTFHGDIERAERVGRKILEMETRYGGDYIAMANVCASAGKYEDVEVWRGMMDHSAASKVPGYSFCGGLNG
ncbi:hypothetical protein MLD38_015995 [Melastoma candidum]|uniref:Uncharacterized protein n=1 Tax=Melastoma candidum TaxID=119954 RepID=A0ACB9RM63_9MYRT|nr:hypothetical protein MLD38_015995 [Melastoma candidum]